MSTQRTHHLRFLAGLLMTALPCFLAMLLFIYGMDPYCAHPASFDQSTCTGDNTRILKAKYLREHPEFDIIALSDSRGMMFDPMLVDKLTGRKAYNFWNIAELPCQLADKMYWLLNTQPTVKTIVVQLWVENLAYTYRKLGISLNTREDREISGESFLSFFWYFSRVPLRYIWQQFADRARASTTAAATASFAPVVDLSTGGLTAATHDAIQKQLTPETTERIFGHNPAADKVFHDLATRNVVLDPDELAQFASAARAVRQAGVQLICLTPAMDRHTQITVPIDLWFNFVSYMLDTCGSLWDFSLFNAMTEDDSNYLEWSHYNRKIADMILRTIFANGKRPDPDFGFYITKANFEQYKAEYVRRWNAHAYLRR